MNDAKYSMLLTYFKTLKREKNYTKISNNKIRERLKTVHGKDIKRRWAFQCAADLEEQGYITRRERYDKTKEYPYGQLSSMTSITLKGAWYMVKKGVAGAMVLVKQIMAWVGTNDKRWPQEKDPGEQHTPEEIKANKARFKKLLAALV